MLRGPDHIASRRGPAGAPAGGSGARLGRDGSERNGVASGEVVAGYTGTQQRATYTCIGDTVNLAARLEAHTKEAGRGILVDGATHAALGGQLPLELLGDVVFKGKALAVPVFAVKTQAQA